MEYQVDFALGKHIIVEPVDESGILRAEEAASIFKVVSFGIDCLNCSELKSGILINKGDFIIVAQNSVEHAMMGGKKVYFVVESDVIAKVKNV